MQDSAHQLNQTPEVTMSNTARITVEITLDREITPQIAEAIANLADVMGVQAEDGLYFLGSPDSEHEDYENEFLAEIERTEVSTKVVTA
jgi:hypothetical protein